MRRSPRPCPRAVAALLLLALAVLTTSPASALVVAVPPRPGAQVPFRLLVSGVTSFVFPAQPAVDVTVDGTTVTLRFEVASQGTATPDILPYAFWVDFPEGLPSGDGYSMFYDVALAGIDGDGDVVWQEHYELGIRPGVTIAVPARVTETQSVSLAVSGVASCPQIGDVTVAGDEIRLDVSVDCVILPPTPAPFTFEVALDPLPPGRYRVVAGTPSQPLGIAALEVLSDPARLHGGDFLAAVDFVDAEGVAGRAQLVLAPTDDSALFWFFAPSNWELMLKVLDGCDLNGHYWVFGAASTDLAYDITVEHTVTGDLWTADNPPGNAAPAITDTRAFPCQGGHLATGGVR